MARANTDDILVALMLTPDEASRLYHTFVNGLQGPDDTVRQTLTVKVEKARTQAQAVRALIATGKLGSTANGKKEAAA